MAHLEKDHPEGTEDNYYSFVRGWKRYVRIIVVIGIFLIAILFSFYAGSRYGIRYVTQHPDYLSSDSGSMASSGFSNDSSVLESHNPNGLISSEPSIVSRIPKNESSTVSESKSGENLSSGQFTAYVNTNSKTFHLDKNCTHCKRIKESNLMEFHYDQVQEIIDAGFTACGTCAKDYKK